MVCDGTTKNNFVLALEQLLHFCFSYVWKDFNIQGAYLLMLQMFWIHVADKNEMTNSPR